jgi:hypothetical protein
LPKGCQKSCFWLHLAAPCCMLLLVLRI